MSRLSWAVVFALRDVGVGFKGEWEEALTGGTAYTAAFRGLELPTYCV